MDALKLLVFSLLALVLSSCASKRKNPCPPSSTSALELDKKVSFKDSEKKLICGDPKTPEWSEIPRTQIEFHLKTFLLERGYYDPTFHKDPNRIAVDVGPRTKIEEVQITGWPWGLPAFRKKLFVGRLLTPANLDELEKELNLALKSEGYACPDFRIVANALKRSVQVEVKPGKRYLFPEISRNEVEDFVNESFERFEAFKSGWIYDYQLLELSERRIRASALVQDVAYLPRCENGELTVRQHFFYGKPRFLSLGAGFDTEQFLIGKGKMTFSRLSKRGASFSTEVYASAKIQSWESLARFYPWAASSRGYYYVGTNFKHEDEKHFESASASGRAGLGTNYEFEYANLEFKAGPLVQRSWIFRGPGLKNTREFALEGGGTFTTHAFEYFLDRPQKGSRAGFEFRSTSRDVGSSFGASKVRLFGENMLRIWEQHNADLLLGFRASVGTSVTQENLGEWRDRVPTEYRFFLGGSQDLRGFSRFELPRGGRGAFSAAFGSVELRLARTFKVEPLIFLDVGALGSDAFRLDLPYYWSPGWGLRYGSPVGTLRSSFAYGYSSATQNEDLKISHFQFFFSFGEEF